MIRQITSLCLIVAFLFGSIAAVVTQTRPLAQPAPAHPGHGPISHANLSRVRVIDARK